MDSVKYNPKIFAVIENTKEYINPIVTSIISSDNVSLIPKTFGVLASNKQYLNDNKLYGVVDLDTSINVRNSLSAVIENQTVKQTHKDTLPIRINVQKQIFSNSTLPIRINVEHISKNSGKKGDIVGYDTEVKPFVTFNFDTQEIFTMYPFFTYSLDGAIQSTVYPFFTYKKGISSSGYRVNKMYYVVFYSNYMKQMIKCRLYDTYKFFPLKDIHMSVLCDDNKIRYLPLDKIGSDFDSGIRVTDSFGNELQVCVARQENVLKKFFSHGNLLIPLTNYSDLYSVLSGLFGKSHVSVEGDGVYFMPPSELSGLTKMFAIGLNIKFTTKFGHQITTYEHGLSKTSFGGDKHWMANSMLIKFHHKEMFKIDFKDAYYNTSYMNDALVKNAIVIGESVEGLAEQSASYKLLSRSRNWYLFDTSKNKIVPVDNNNTTVRYFKEKYLKYPNAIKMYNFYDLQKYKLEKVK